MVQEHCKDSSTNHSRSMNLLLSFIDQMKWKEFNQLHFSYCLKYLPYNDRQYCAYLLHVTVTFIIIIIISDLIQNNRKFKFFCTNNPIISFSKKFKKNVLKDLFFISAKLYQRTMNDEQYGTYRMKFLFHKKIISKIRIVISAFFC